MHGGSLVVIAAFVVIAGAAGCADGDEPAAAATDEGPLITLKYEANA